MLLADTAPWFEGNEAMAAHASRELTPWEPLPMQLDHTSTYASHFQKWPLPPKKSYGPKKGNFESEPSTFDTRSTAQDSYQPFDARAFKNAAFPSCRPQSAYTATAWLQPLSTTHRDAFQQWPARNTIPFKPKSNRQEPEDTPTGRSTSQDSYQPFMNFVPTKSCHPVERVLEKTPFEGTTTSRAAFLQWPIPPKHGRKKPQAQVGWGGDDAGAFPTSTYRDAFREISLPKGASSALGVQVAGGKFYPVIARGSQPPATKRVMMTTTRDKQTSMDIVVVITQDEQGRKGKKLGEFELDGIAPNRAGTAQIEVTFTLSMDNTLRVSALDKQGNRARHLKVNEKVRLQ